ncbi:MAG: hypothetical protein P4N59_25830 [Negativicutes bacterium]|nr:hypothetical protein [Negativicutes bacterium]
MKKDYSEDQVRDIASECREFEHVINAMGYGYSFVNVKPETYARRCPDCVRWLGGSCRIYKAESGQMLH